MEKLTYKELKASVTKEQLEELYSKYSVREMSKILNAVNERVVSAVMKEFGIKVYRAGSCGKAVDYDELMNKISYDELYDYYVTQCNSHMKCAKHFGLTGKVMYKLICKYNIHKTKDQKLLTDWKSKEDKYGYKYYNNSKQISETGKKTRSLHNEEIVAKMKATKLERYGDENYTGEGGFYHCNYNDGDITFYSLPELAFWKYAIDHNEDIEREPIAFKFEYNGKMHKYKPDFRYKGELIEIKGDHMVNENGVLFDVWGDHKNDDFYKAKYDCAIKNGVKFMFSSDYNKYLDYFESNYNKMDFIKQPHH